jgi:predicted GIY-YIG superfamily endonuclease
MRPEVIRAPRWVYEIRDAGDDPVYVGVTHDPKSRWSQHKTGAKTLASNAAVHHLMRHVGVSEFYMEAVSYHTGFVSAYWAEKRRIEELTEAGVPLANKVFGGLNRIDSDQKRQRLLAMFCLVEPLPTEQMKERTNAR